MTESKPSSFKSEPVIIPYSRPSLSETADSTGGGGGSCLKDIETPRESVYRSGGGSCQKDIETPRRY